jgi:5'-nucleotidase
MTRRREHALLALLVVAGLHAGDASAAEADVVTLSIVGTTDVHGNIFPRDGRGGLTLLGGYLNNLRAARAADGGAVLLIDSGDTYQGGIESNLSDGAIVVDAYDALGYTASVIGNHEFDFGPADGPGARQQIDGDPRGSIKARAAQAHYPFLAANLIDETTGKRVDWPNVHAATLVEAAGVKVGIIGVMTIDALRATLRANVEGLRVAPLAATVTAEAKKLRAAGAEIVIVGSHAGGSCGEFRTPTDLSSCDANAEMFEVARAVPHGLIDAIVAGHTHQAVAHEVEGVAIVQAYALGRWFSRVDLEFDRRERRIVTRRPFAPRELCSVQDPLTLSCEPQVSGETALPAARYENRVVTADPAIDAAMAPALARVRALQATELGIVLDTPIPRTGDTESPLGNLFADAQRAGTPGADVAINNNFRGGLRADLPEGTLTLGRLYDAFPFDNRLVRLKVTGAELRRLFADEILRNRRGALAVSGLRVRTACSTGGVDVELVRDSGEPVALDDELVVVATDQLMQGVVFASTGIPMERRMARADAPVMREVVEAWLRARGGHIDAGAVSVPNEPRWRHVDAAGACSQ